MGHHSCCNKQKVRRGLWSPEEDEKLINYISTYGHGCWSSVPRLAGLQRCGKSCRLRWINYLRPDLKRGSFSPQEASLIIELHRIMGNRWAQIAKHLPGRTDNEVKNFWNSSIKKKLISKANNIANSDLTTSLPDHFSNSFGSLDGLLSSHDHVIPNLVMGTQQDFLFLPGATVPMLQGFDYADHHHLKNTTGPTIFNVDCVNNVPLPSHPIILDASSCDPTWSSLSQPHHHHQQDDQQSLVVYAAADAAEDKSIDVNSLMMMPYNDDHDQLACRSVPKLQYEVSSMYECGIHMMPSSASLEVVTSDTSLLPLYQSSTYNIYELQQPTSQKELLDVEATMPSPSSSSLSSGHLVNPSLPSNWVP